MEIVIISILIIILILIIFMMFKVQSLKSSNLEVYQVISKLEKEVVKEISNFKIDFSKELNMDFARLNDKIDTRLELISDKVSARLDENFERTNKTFRNVVERLSRIDEAQKKIDLLSTDIVSLQSILTDKKTRGIFGEVNLNHILVNIFGEKQTVYKLQHKLSNGFIADCMLECPSPLGHIAIDAKFPLENFQNMTNLKISKELREKYLKQFRLDMKKHIDDISRKYIITNETADQAILFLPAEAIFAELNAYHCDIIEYAYKKKVWIVSPTTFISTLSTIQVIINNIEKDKYTSIIHQELNLLSVEFNRYKERWDKLYRSIETVSKDVKDIHTTTDKITKRFVSINHVDILKIEGE